VSGLHSRSYSPTGRYLGRLHGWARIGYSPSAHTLSVTVTASGLPPGAHAAHIHLGSCQDQGAVKYMLMDFQADRAGAIVNQTRTVTGVTSAPPARGWYLNLHLGDGGDIVANGMPTLNFRPELCADVTSVAPASQG
jgi:Cu/Zn superoxide dismutase